ncbi:MAG TPA: S49 family peptidase, partial [Thermohalobaculum sp.]|nr:S49 family peptidase [Thermohalobaculum sp.]
MSRLPRRALGAVLDQPWAIRPSALNSIVEVVQRHGEGPEALAARLGRPLENTARAELRDGVAVIPVTGPIFPRANLMTEHSGATSLALLATDLTAALENDRVAAVVLDIDSPGGVAFGIGEMADMIAAASKPVIAYAGGMAASAAYWIASAADEIVAHPTALLGSIGVVQALLVQERPDSEGFREFEIVSSNAPNKRPDPREDAGREEIRRVLDALESEFVAAVARGRGVGAETVLSDFGRGGLLPGRDRNGGADAISAGMADRLGTLEDVLAGLAAGAVADRDGRLIITVKETKTMTTKLTAASVAADHPEVAEALRNEGREAGYKDGFTAGQEDGHKQGAAAGAQEALERGRQAGLAEGATAERARIAALTEASLPGYDKLLAECIADGKSTAADLALKQQAVLKRTRAAAIEGAAADEAALSDPANPLPAPAPAQASATKDPAAIAEEARAVIAEEAKAGRTLSTAEAVRRV